EHADRVPRHRLDAERLAHSRLAQIVPAGPALQPRQDAGLQTIRPTGAMILPWEEVVTVDPGRAGRRLLLSNEREVCDRQEPLADVRTPVAIAERIELLHVAELETGTMPNPAPQAALERRVGGGVERARRNGRAVWILQRY